MNAVDHAAEVAEHVLARVSFHDAHFWLERTLHGRARLCMAKYVKDSRADNGSVTMVYFSHDCQWQLSENAWLDELHWLIYDFAQHEADEFIRFDGELAFDPHPRQGLGVRPHEVV